MKLPLTPPPMAELFLEAAQERLQKVMEHSKPLADGKYVHWDNLRHRTPPPELSIREWWLAIKMARMSAREAIPFVDKQARHFGLVYAAPLRQGLHRIDQGFGKTGTSSEVQTMVDAHGQHFLLTNSLMEEAIRSSQLEGASTTRSKAKDMLREGRRPSNKSERMILNNFLAMERIEELARYPLSQDLIFELHKILVDGTLDDPEKAGAFRTDDDNIVVELLHSVETAHVPPRAAELPVRMERLLDFANGRTPEDWLHPVLRAVILHFMIGYDHPFIDGNGRVARALFYWAMARHGYPLTRYLSISRVLRDAPAKYARAYLYTETDDSDLTYFVDYHLEVILESITALEQYVQKKMADTKEVEALLRDSRDLNHRQIRLLNHALRHPGFQYTVTSHQTSHRVVNNTARADLVDLAARGLLLQSRRGRQHVFVAPRNLPDLVAGLSKR